MNKYTDGKPFHAGLKELMQKNFYSAENPIVKKCCELLKEIVEQESK